MILISGFCLEASKIRAALDCYSEQRGLDRSLEIATDLTNLDHSSENSSHPGPSLHILAQTKRISELMQFKDKDEGALRSVHCRLPVNSRDVHLILMSALYCRQNGEVISVILLRTSERCPHPLPPLFCYQRFNYFWTIDRFAMLDYTILHYYFVYRIYAR